MTVQAMCQANALDVCFFAGASLEDIESEIRSVADCGDCDSELNIDLINVTPGTAGHLATKSYASSPWPD